MLEYVMNFLRENHTMIVFGVGIIVGGTTGMIGVAIIVFDANDRRR